MANSVDNRVVRMEFDNGQFQEKVASTMESLKNLDSSLLLQNGEKGFKSVQAAARDMNLDKISSDVDQLNSKFSSLGVVAASAINNITNRVVDMGLAMGSKAISAVTIDPIKNGFEEYKLQLNSIQTIMTNTKKYGTTIEDVNDTLGELNKYADQTIYNFGDMTRSIGQFTQAGLDLDTSTKAIKGMSNLAAGFGADKEQLSRAMYQMSQGLSSGVLKLMDWRSMINASMGGKSFQDALIMVSEEMGTGAEAAIEKQGSFNDSLTEGWMTAEVMVETLNRLTTEGAAALDETKVKNKEFWVEQAKSFEDAATKIKTFDQLIEVIGEELGSGWATSWGYIFGNFEEAKELWTGIGTPITNFISQMHDARNVVLEFWHDQQEGFKHSGREYLIAGFTHIVEALQSIVAPIADAFGAVFSTVEYVEDEFGISTAVISDFGKSVGTAMTEASRAFARFTKNLKMGEGYYNTVRTIFEGLFNVAHVLGFVFEKVLTGGVFLASKAFEAFAFVLNLAFNVISAIGEPLLKLAEQGFTAIADTVSGVFKAIEDSGLSFEPLAKFIEAAARAIGGFLRDLSEGKPIAEAWETLCHKLSVQWDRLGRNFKPVTDAVEDFVKMLSNEFLPQTDEFGNVTQNTYTKASNAAKTFFEGASAAIEGVREKIGPFIEFIKTAAQEFSDFLTGTQRTDDLGQIDPNYFRQTAKAIGDFAGRISDTLGRAWDMITNFVGNISTGDIIKGLSALFTGGMLWNVLKFMKSVANIAEKAEGVSTWFSDFLGGISQIPKSFNDLIHSFGDTVEDIGKAAKMKAVAEIIKSVALAIAALAVSLYLLSKVEPDDLTRIAVTLGLLMAAIMGMTTIMMKFSPVESIKEFAGLLGVASSLFAIGGAMLLFAAAVKLFSMMDIGELARGIGAIAVIMLTLVGVAKLMSMIKMSMGDVTKLAASIFVVALAMGAMATACILFNFVSPEAMMKAALALLLIVAAGARLSQVSHESGSFLKLAGSLVILAVAMQAMAAACLIFSVVDPRGVARAAAAMAELVVAAVVLANLSNNVGNFGKLSANLAALAGTMIILGAACLIFSQVSPEGMLNATTAMAGLVVVMAALAIIGEIFKKGTETMAASLISIAMAMAIFAGVVAFLGSLPFGAVIAGVVGLGLAFAVVIAAAWGAQKVIVGLEALAAAMIPIGLGLGAIGVGMFAFALGLATLAAMGPASTDAIIQAFIALGEGLIELGKRLGIAMAEAILSIMTALADMAPQFLEVGRQLVTQWQAIVDSGLIADMGRLAGAMILQFAAGLGEMVGAIVSAGAIFIVSILSGIAEHMQELVDAGMKVAISFLNGVANALDTNQGPLLDAIGHLFLSIAALLMEGLARIVEQFPGIGAQAAEAIRGWKDTWAPAAEEAAEATSEAADPEGKIADKYSDEMEKAKDTVTEGGDDIMSQLKEVSDSTGIEFNLDPMVDSAEQGTQATAAVIESIPYADITSGKATEAVKAFSDSFSHLGDGASTAVTGAIKAIQSGDFAGPAKKQGGRALSGFKAGLNPSAWKTAGSNAAGQAKSGVESRNLYQSGYTIGKGLGEGLVAGMDAMLPSVREKGDELGKAAAEATNKVPGVHSPSKFTLRIGEGLGEGLILGMSNMMSSVEKTGEELGSKTTEAVSFATDSLNGLDTNAMPVIRPVLDTSMVDEGMSRILGGSPTIDVGYVASKLAAAHLATANRPEQMQNPSRTYEFNLNYNAGEDANQMVRDMAVAVRQSADF